MNERTRLALVLGAGLVGVGVLALVVQFLNPALVALIIPVGIAAIGLLLLAILFARGRPRDLAGTFDSGWLAVPGVMLVMFGLVLLFQTTTGYWSSGAYLWTLVVPLGAGIGLLILSWWSDRSAPRWLGLVLSAAGLGLFLVLGGCFELFALARGETTPGRFLLPLALIILGALVLFWRRLLGLWLTGRRADSTIVTVKTVESQPTALPKGDRADSGQS